MAYNALNNLIDAYIYANGVQAITGQILNGVLKQMVSQLGSGYHLMGVAGPETVPASNDYAMAYFAATAGEYTDFGGITIAAGEVAVLLTSGNGSWEKQTIYNVPTGTADLENTANFITNAVTDLVNYYTKTEIDTTLADYPTLQGLATALADYYTKTEIDGQMGDVDTALADRYTKSETDTKLADYYKKTETYDKDEVDSIVAALSRQEYIVAWDGTTVPDVSAIPAGVTVTYSGTPYTGTLAASASTVNKIYMIWNGVAYDMYGTSQDGGYSWVPMGTTSVDLSQYATKAEVNQLEAKVDELETGIEGIVDIPISYNVTTGTAVNTSNAGVGATPVDIPSGTRIKIKVSGTAQISTTNGFTAYLKKADGITNVDTISFSGQTEVTYTLNEDVAYIGFYCLGNRIESDGTLVFTVEYMDESGINTRLSKLEDICESVKFERVKRNSIVNGYYIYKTGEWLASQYFRVEIYPVTEGKKYYVDVEYNNTNYAFCAFYSSVPTSSSSPISKIPYTDGISKYIEVPSGASYIAVSMTDSIPVIDRIFNTGDVNKVVDKITKGIYFAGFENRGKNVLYVGDSISTSFYWREFLRDDFGLNIEPSKVSVPASVGGIPLIPPVVETTGLESIWWRCSSERLKGAGYAPDIISILGGFNDMVNSSLPVGSVNDTPFVDDSSDFTETTVDVRPETLTFCAALKGCVLMLKRDFPNAEIVLPTVMYCTGRGTTPQTGDTIILSEKLAIKQVEIAQYYGLRFIPWYWSERSINTISVFSADGVHPTIAGARIMERWFAQYLPVFV